MTDNHDPTGNSEFICEFGPVTLGKPFSEQPAIQKYLDVPFSQAGRLVSDEFLFRLLAIAECVIKKDLDASGSEYQLVDLYLGYEVLTLLPGADLQDSQPKTLEESAWVSTKDDAEDETIVPESLTDSFITPVIKQLIRRCLDETIQRINSINPKVLVDKFFYFLRGELRFQDRTFTLSAKECLCPPCKKYGKKQNVTTKLCTEPC